MSRSSAVLLLAALTVPGTSAAFAREALPFVADDYPKAVAQARERNVPLFVEAWAPW